MHKEDKGWLDYRAQFHAVYDQFNYESSIQAKLMRVSHRLLEKDFNQLVFLEKVLEIGAGTGGHIPFVRHIYEEYVLSDSDEKALEVAQKKLVTSNNPKLRFEQQQAQQLAYPDDSFDRVIAAHVLEHVYQPHLALKEWARVVKNGGTLSILIPTDPGVAWRLGRHFGPRKDALARGIPYDYIMAREHVNSCNNLIALIRYYFSERTERWWPFPIPSMDLNLFYVCHARVR